MSHRSSRLGARGEDIAANYLKDLGYSIIARNYRTRYGEIDIIARLGETLVFTEVKTRRTTAFGPPSAAVGSRKQAQISRVAMEYIARVKHRRSARFDVIAILLPDNGAAEVELITNAFELHCPG